MFLIAAVYWLERLVELDKWLFIKLNSQLTNPFFDALFPFLRDSLIWTPLYLFILVFIWLNYGTRGVLWSLAFICTVAITDIIGARVFKAGVARLRPCRDPEFMDQVRLLLNQCSGSFSFISNHAANHFSLATFAFLTFRPVFGNWMYIGFVWALFIAYAQVYVGVHYPLDVIAGGALGVLTGAFMARIFNTKVGSFAAEH